MTRHRIPVEGFNNYCLGPSALTILLQPQWSLRKLLFWNPTIARRIIAFPKKAPKLQIQRKTQTRWLLVPQLHLTALFFLRNLIPEEQLQLPKQTRSLINLPHRHFSHSVKIGVVRPSRQWREHWLKAKTVLDYSCLTPFNIKKFLIPTTLRACECIPRQQF